MNKFRLAIVALVLLVLVGAGLWVTWRRDASRSLLSGTFESQPVEIASRVGGRVIEVAKEGSQVRQGEQIVELEATPEVQGTLSLEAQESQLRARLAEAEQSRDEAIRQQEEALRIARADLAKLWAGPRPEEIARARAGVREAEARLRDLSLGSRTAEIRRAREAVQEAEARLRKIRYGASIGEREKALRLARAARELESQAERDERRQRTLRLQGAASAAQAEAARTTYRVAREQRRAAEAAVAALEPRREDVDAARAAVEQAKQTLRLLEEGPRKETVDATRAILEQNQAYLRLLQAGPRAEDVRAAEARVAQAQEILNSLRTGSRTDVLEQAAAALAAARAQSKASQSRTNERIVIAPAAGVLERVLVTRGDLVQPGQTVARLSDPNDVFIRIFVPEDRLAKVRVGDEAILNVDGVAGQVTAIVESIATQGEFSPANLQTPEERGRQSFAVRLGLRKPDMRVKPGMTATVRRIGSWSPGE